ncbi:MAG: chemotaxis protein CheA [Litoreibacter sp.]
MRSSPILDTFFEECEDLIEALTEGLSAIQEGTQDTDTIHAVFRAVHSVKGGAGAFGLDALVSFAHTFENVLDNVRSEKLAIDDALMALFLRASDQLAYLVEAARDETEVDTSSCETIVKQLNGYLVIQDEKAGLFCELPLSTEKVDADPPEIPDRTVTVSFLPNDSLYKNGHEPLFLFQALAALGEIDVTLDDHELPSFDAFNPENAYLSWQIRIKTKAALTSVEEIFEFVETLCEVEISEDLDLQDESLTDEVITSKASLDASEDIKPDTATKVSKPSPQASKETKAHKPTVRVDLERVDRLMNTVGELIINQAMLTQGVTEFAQSGTREIESQLENYRMLARDLQEDVMAIRAQPVKPLFQRMARIVREASTATGKNARLVMVGEATEVDKTVIERLADPLTHMIRNAVDHGLEAADVRRKNGKEEVGEINLSASHRSGSVFIEINDDGAGINRDRIYNIAVDRGLIQDGVELSDNEIDNLLFLPGFSTASSVSNLSGRGVGMDVVKNAVTALGGRVSISSVLGEGTRFSVVLPLTLAVMDGMVISVANQTMVIPITSILETIRPAKEDIHPLGPDGPLLSIRGRFVPIIDVAQALAFEDVDTPLNKKILILLETQHAGQCALAVEAILDQRQVVIKSLDGVDDDVPGVAAATILGDGKIAMILDPDGVVKIANESHMTLPHKGGIPNALAG